MNAFERAAAEHHAVVDAAVETMSATFDAVAELVVARLLAGRSVFVCGNGGSAADAQHFAAEVVGRFTEDRRALPVLALHTDTSTMTAIANDSGFERVFARQVEAFGRRDDVLIAISTSGRSPNVVEAAQVARSRGMCVIVLTGTGRGELELDADHVLAVPSQVVARVQEVHELVLHTLAEVIENAVIAADGGRDD